MHPFPYDRKAAIEYAEKWAYSRNPLYYSFDKIGGDCTNFVSQCVYAGSGMMNFSPIGWYYTSLNDRSPSWTGVPFFKNFLITNKSLGPYAALTTPNEIIEGDVVQLSQGGDFTHSLLVTYRSVSSFLVSAHSSDAFNRPLSSYNYKDIRFLHIIAVRK